MTSFKHQLYRLPQGNKSEAIARLLEVEDSSYAVGQSEVDRHEGQSSFLEMNNYWRQPKESDHVIPFLSSFPRVADVGGGMVHIQDFSAMGESVDVEESFYTMITNPFSTFLSNSKFIQFLQSYQRAAYADRKDNNDKVQGQRVNDCHFGSRKSNPDSFPYSPSCELEPVSSDEDVTSGREMSCVDHCPSRMNETHSRGALEMYNASCSGSDVFEGGSPDSIPSSAAELNRISGLIEKQERIRRISSEVKISLDPFFKKNAIDKVEYKHILKGAVNKIYQAKDKRIVPSRIKKFVESYVHKVQLRRHPKNSPEHSY